MRPCWPSTRTRTGMSRMSPTGYSTTSRTQRAGCHTSTTGTHAHAGLMIGVRWRVCADARRSLAGGLRSAHAFTGELQCCGSGIPFWRVWGQNLSQNSHLNLKRIVPSKCRRAPLHMGSGAALYLNCASRSFPFSWSSCPHVKGYHRREKCNVGT